MREKVENIIREEYNKFSLKSDATDGKPIENEKAFRFRFWWKEETLPGLEVYEKLPYQSNMLINRNKPKKLVKNIIKLKLTWIWRGEFPSFDETNDPSRWANNI